MATNRFGLRRSCTSSVVTKKGGADEGQGLPLLALDRSRTRLLRNLLDIASRQSDPAGQPLQLRCTSPMLAGGLVVEAVLPCTAL